MTPHFPIYMDYGATTPVDPRVVDAMIPWLREHFGNPASRSHAWGWEAEEAVEKARVEVAQLIGADPREIVWTSGATESNNLAIKGAANFYQSRGKHIITVKTEHKAVLDTCRELERQGFEVTYLPVQENGLIDLAAFKAAIRPDTILASRQAKEIGFNPKVFYASVGTAFPLYKNVMTPAGAEGVMGMGSWNGKTSAGAKAYFDAHVASQKKEPDRWASGACWAALEILTNAVAKNGLNRKAIRDYVAGTTHKTILGDIRFEGSENVGTPGTVSQWQKGEFEVVWPQKVATAKLIAKPVW